MANPFQNIDDLDSLSDFIEASDDRAKIVDGEPCSPSSYRQHMKLEPDGEQLIWQCPLPVPRVPGRLHIRAHFYDYGDQDAHHWLGFTFKLGACALGIHPSVRDR